MNLDQAPPAHPHTALAVTRPIYCLFPLPAPCLIALHLLAQLTVIGYHIPTLALLAVTVNGAFGTVGDATVYACIIDNNFG